MSSSSLSGPSLTQKMSRLILLQGGQRGGMIGRAGADGHGPRCVWNPRLTDMTHRERMLAAIRGQAVDCLPWAPRMDLWCIALRARGALPDRFVGLNTAEIADELDVACHAARADYTLPRDPADLALRGLGFDNHPDYPYRVELGSLPMTFEHEAERYATTVRTPAGDVTIRLSMTQQMAAEGISLPFVEKYPIESPADFEPVARVFEDLVVVPTPQAYASFRERVGQRGLALANGCGLAASPMHLLMHDLMAMEEFFVCYADQRRAMEQLAARMVPLFEALLDAVLQCEAEVVFWGANYDRDTTWPPFFIEQICPWLQRVGDRLQAAGKLLLTHTDGENRDLLEHYPSCRFDVAESVCPSPMTSLTLAQIRAGMGPNVCVWGGIPCVVLIDQATDEAEFERHMDRAFAELGTGCRLILAVSDNVPPDANLDRLKRIKDWIDRFGPVAQS